MGLVKNRLREISTNGGGLLEPMPREASGHKQASEVGPLAQNRISVQVVDCVDTGPGILDSEFLKCGEVVDQTRPDQIFESLSRAGTNSKPIGSSGWDIPINQRFSPSVIA